MDRRGPRMTTAAALGAIAIASGLASALPARASAPPGRWQITTNGTADDTSDDTVLDVKTQLRWQRAFSPPVTWDANAGPGSAQAYCAALSVGAFTSGWRLPGLKELVSIVDVRSRPAFDAKAFVPVPLGDVTGSARRFWSATPDAGSATATDGGPPTYSRGWLVGPGAGHAIQWNASDPNVARCVHAP